MKWNLIGLMTEVEELHSGVGLRLSVASISRATGIDEKTILSMKNNKTKRPDTRVMDLLLKYFNDQLPRKINTNDLWTWENSAEVSHE